MTTGEIIKDLLKQKGTTQSDLARFLNVSPNTVNRWIPTNKKEGIEPSHENIRKIAEYFGVSVDIIDGSAGKYNSPEHMNYTVDKHKKWEAFEQLLCTFGYKIENNSYDAENNTIQTPTEYNVSWGHGIDKEQRFIKAVDFDNLLKRMEQHIAVELENYY